MIFLNILGRVGSPRQDCVTHGRTGVSWAWWRWSRKGLLEASTSRTTVGGSVGGQLCWGLAAPPAQSPAICCRHLPPRMLGEVEIFVLKLDGCVTLLCPFTLPSQTTPPARPHLVAVVAREIVLIRSTSRRSNVNGNLVGLFPSTVRDTSTL